MLFFQDIIFKLQEYWVNQNCAIIQPIDLKVGAATFHPETFLRALGPNHFYSAYVQLSSRPADSRYGYNPHRRQSYYQFQVVMKPTPYDFQELYLDSLRFLDIDLLHNDVRFIEDNWKSPTLGAWGTGWEIWMNGMEISQFTYFQQVGGLACRPVTGEITYGLERLAMHLQNVKNVYDIVWAKTPSGLLYYSDMFQRNEREMSQYNFKESNVLHLFKEFDFLESESIRLLKKDLLFPAYEMLLNASHVFNMLDARRAISVTERQNCVLRLCNVSKSIAKFYTSQTNTRFSP